MRFLALILFTPAFLILAWLYWKFPRALPRTPRRRTFDLAALALAFAATAVSVSWAMSQPPAAHGAMWPQILAVLAAYHVFPLALAVAWLVRGRLISPVS